MADADREAAAEEELVGARWPDGPRCPRCDSSVASRRRTSRRRWRCRGCRYDFCVTSGTRLHASKAPLSAWVAAARGGGSEPLEGVSPTTRRRILSAVEATGLGPGTERLAALLSGGVQVRSSGPLDGLAPGSRRVLAALRCRLDGASAARVAADADLSPAHARRCLRRLSDLGFVESEETVVMWGYAPRRLRVWRLRLGARTLDALPQMGWLSPAEPLDPPLAVPPEFWSLFWSGECASRLALPEDAVHVADTLVGGPDEPARIWALRYLPLDSLRELRAIWASTCDATAPRFAAEPWIT